MVKLTTLIEGLDPIGKEDDDVNNDGKVNSQDKYIMNRRKTIAKNINEDCGCGDMNHDHDHEAKMAKGEIRDMIMNAIQLYKMIQVGQNLPGWVSAYITLSSDYIHSVTEYMTENNSLNENKQIATDYQFTPSQIELLKKYKAKLSTGGNDLYIPDLLKIQLDRNVKDSKFKQDFYETYGPERRQLASQVMTAMKKAISIGGKANIPVKNQQGQVSVVPHHVIKGHMTSEGNFNFPNPFRPESN
jgi:hypothetical protein